jgi:hypothetical protein
MTDQLADAQLALGRAGGSMIALMVSGHRINLSIRHAQAQTPWCPRIHASRFSDGSPGLRVLCTLARQ